ncbi:MAG: D-amino acid dehydrogenase [Hydrogenophaga sp.]|jgi:D-amino-acid dehydrogenase|nr:D-amino acid dehydrogenase [Hydrogenophaga sp.]
MTGTTSDFQHVVVIGAGIVGLATAWRLQREGHTVTVIDGAHSGAGASAANGAQLSYAYVQPLADPAIWRQLPKLLLAEDSPLKLRLRLDPQQWAWGLRFLAACRASVSRASTAWLLQLAAESRAAFDTLLRELPMDCDLSTTGKLVLYPDAASLDSARRQVALQQSLGAQQSVLSAAECVDLEPALAHSVQRFAGAVHTPGECAADCLKVCQALEQALRSRGVAFRLGDAATGWRLKGGQVESVQTLGGLVQADAFVVALGTGSVALARQLGLGLPVYPLKGYSITLDIGTDDGARVPRVNVTDAGRKLVFARISSRLRVAGMAELVGHDRSIDPRRIRALVDATRDTFPMRNAMADVQPWAGLRPATPTGRPILGRLPGAPDNVLFNTGHGALGFTLAFGSAERVVAALRDGVRPSAEGLAACSA